MLRPCENGPNLARNVWEFNLNVLNQEFSQKSKVATVKRDLRQHKIKRLKAKYVEVKASKYASESNSLHDYPVLTVCVHIGGKAELSGVLYTHYMDLLTDSLIWLTDLPCLASLLSDIEMTKIKKIKRDKNLLPDAN